MSGILKFPRTGHGFHLRNECANLTSNGITIAETSSSTFVCTGKQLFFPMTSGPVVVLYEGMRNLELVKAMYIHLDEKVTLKNVQNFFYPLPD